MVRSYRRYEPGQVFGTIATASSNTVWTADASSRNAGSGRAFVGANEEVLCWDVKKGELLSRWNDKDNKSVVTCVSQCEVQPDLFAVGHQDGSIRIWDALSGQIVVSFNVHRSAITQLQFDRDGSRLASGSRDTDIIIWNLLSETAEVRLKGHKDQITGIAFLRTPVSAAQEDDEVNGVAEQDVEERYLLSTSKDALIKIWDLSAQHCIETHVAQTSGECWALGMSPEGAGCITAGNDGELKVWSLDVNALAELGSTVGESKKQDVLQSQGIIHRQGKDRTVGVAFHPKQDYISVHGSEKAVELFRIRSAEELHRVMLRKRKRRREKLAAAGQTLAPEKDEAIEQPDVTDVFVPYVVLRTGVKQPDGRFVSGGKVRSANWITAGSKASKKLQLLVSTTDNRLEVYEVVTYRGREDKASRTGPEYDRSLTVELPGHRADIRTLALSSDDRMLASASSGALKVWNLRTQSCLRTMECGPALCSAFLPGDRMVLLGNKNGELELWDISTSTLIEKIQAHDEKQGAIWSLAVHPDGRSVVTGSADKSAKFWRFDIVDEEIPGTRRTTQRLKLTQTRQLKVNDDVLSICFSPDQKYLALSTLDNTVKLFFVDSLKQYHILYGHKLPVLNISISSDSKLITTSSADKNVKVWGLDFGDCHKSFFAHQDSVMQVGFIPHPQEQEERHMIFSAGKDGVLKSWDGDKFEQIQKLDGHHGEIWAMAISRTGETVVTASHDKSIRTWHVGDDLIFLEEERERELEEQYEATLAKNMDRDFEGDEDGDAEVAVASKQTISTLTHGEKIMEALEVGITDLELMTEHNRQRSKNPKMAAFPQERNPVFMALGNISAEQHVLKTLQHVPRPALNDALLVIPFSTLPTLFTFLAIFLRKRMAPELAWTIAYFMLQAHMNQIVASRQLKEVLTEIYDAYEQWQEEEKRVMGFNLAALEIMTRDARENEGVNGGYLDYDKVEDAGQETSGRKKRAFASLA
ncbi:Putative small-subunit processome, Utp12, WD40/YVTN repeat-like-containing domain superfamily [Septoria linicola]|uniref:Small-subunit processome, Utp12, WD40/YVTN repeat-like-containing domain superfamily n=1 Tax=Septoria linicola TaxID=215465 RepID=A0A9Q9AVS3_9PEZI|nr:putative small-subunit processome, Utp12, WD40/YVTN repeat-like-containing domain superfamily [Septoria linicola]USW54098.1 Putative small-subunit processome, Utp12, WD40/YVTN repeat-like-containing domain superfamily [Septoria linicola]